MKDKDGGSNKGRLATLEKTKNVPSFSRCTDNVNYLSNILADVKTDCFHTDKNADCATINHVASCYQAS